MLVESWLQESLAFPLSTNPLDSVSDSASRFDPEPSPAQQLVVIRLAMTDVSCHGQSHRVFIERLSRS